MKTILTVAVCIIFVSVLRADETKYEKAMKKNISMIDSAKDFQSYLDIANAFERIALSEKDKWLPYYYTSLVYVLASFTDSTKSNKDAYLDKADSFIGIADSLQPDESEIYVMKGMIAQSRMSVDPMNRWMKYGQESGKNFQKAIELDTLNPRPEYLIGVGLFYTPEQFGGGAKAAKPVLEKSMKKFEEFVPKDDLMPIWGRKAVEGLLKNINETEQTPEQKQAPEQN